MLKIYLTNIIGQAIVAASRAIKVYNLKIYSKNHFEITPEQYVILNILKADSYSQARLCELLLKDKSNMTRLVSILEEKGLIQKKQDTENGKQINKISISEKGRDLCNKITPCMEISRNKYLKDVTQDEMYTCIKVLNKIKNNIDEA